MQAVQAVPLMICPTLARSMQDSLSRAGAFKAFLGAPILAEGPLALRVAYPFCFWFFRGKYGKMRRVVFRVVLNAFLRAVFAFKRRHLCLLEVFSITTKTTLRTGLTCCLFFGSPYGRM